MRARQVVAPVCGAVAGECLAGSFGGDLPALLDPLGDPNGPHSGHWRGGGAYPKARWAEGKGAHRPAGASAPSLRDCKPLLARPLRAASVPLYALILPASLEAVLLTKSGLLPILKKVREWALKGTHFCPPVGQRVLVGAKSLAHLVSIVLANTPNFVEDSAIWSDVSMLARSGS